MTRPSSLWSTLLACPLAHASFVQDEGRQDEPGNLFGESIAAVGDVDGDGIADFVVGAPRTSSDGPSKGRAWLVSTRTGRAILDVSDGRRGSLFGDRVAGPGDLDGDGIPDFMVSAPGRDGVCVVRSYSGKTGRVLHEIPCESRNNVVEPCGVCFCGVGNVDGDECDDYAIGCVHSDSWPDEPVAIRIVSGRSGSSLRTINLCSAAPHDGLALASVRSVRGRSLGDLVIGVPRIAGAVEVASARQGDVFLRLNPAGAKEAYRIRVCSNGDLDGDGTADLLVSLVNGLGSRSRIVAYSGKDGSTIREWKERGSWSFGSVVDVVGDVDGDGTPDLLVTAPETLSEISHAFILSGREDRVIHSVAAGPWNASAFGVSGCGIGDVDGDQVPDFLVGEASYRAAASMPGFVRLYSGRTGCKLACWGQDDIRSPPR